MATLTIHSGTAPQTLDFQAPAPLAALLDKAECAPARPCGGRGQCGKCAVTVTGAVSEPNEAERRAGARLACQAVLLGDAQVYLPRGTRWRQIELGGADTLTAAKPMPGDYGAAIDIGTTTVALKLFDLHSGRCVGAGGMPNPQIAVAADVMGRIGAALDGKLDALQEQITAALNALLTSVCAESGIDAQAVRSLVVTGNTTMLYLLTGRDPRSLSRAPFEADTLFDAEADVLGRRAYLPPCMNAFVGADITCAVLASGMCGSDETALLCDVGTNGEIALWHHGTLYVTSTAAGPAFEGAGISCGCGSIDGAIDRVWTESGALKLHTIGNAPPVGLCGSGLIDAVAAFLDSEDISPTGAIEAALPLCPGVTLAAADIRAVQLAKAAIAAGIETAMQRAGVSQGDIAAFYIAGGFGSHLNLQSAAAISLFPASLTAHANVIGNAALDGAARLLLDTDALDAVRAIAARARHIPLSGDPDFNDAYIEHMLFGDPDDF